MANLDFVRNKGFFEGMPSGTFLSSVLSVASFGVGGLFVMIDPLVGGLFLAAPFLCAIVWNILVNSLGLGRARYLRLSLTETSALAYTLGFLWERSGTFRLTVALALIALLALGASKVVVGPSETALVKDAGYESAGMRKRRTAPDEIRRPVFPQSTIASTGSRA